MNTAFDSISLSCYCPPAYTLVTLKEYENSDRKRRKAKQWSSQMCVQRQHHLRKFDNSCIKKKCFVLENVGKGHFIVSYFFYWCLWTRLTFYICLFKEWLYQVLRCRADHLWWTTNVCFELMNGKTCLELKWMKMRMKKCLVLKKMVWCHFNRIFSVIFRVIPG